MRTIGMIALALIGCGHKKEAASSGGAGSANGSAIASGSGSATEGSAGSAAGSGDVDTTCADRAARLEKRLNALTTATPGFMPQLHDVHAPDAAAGKPFEQRGVVLAVAKNGAMYLQGSKLTGTKEAIEALDGFEKSSMEKFAMAGGSLRDAHFPLYIWADADAPAGPIADVLATAAPKASHWAVRLLVAGKTAAPSAGEPTGDLKALAATLPGSEPEGTRYLADQLKAAMGSCKPLIMALGTSTIDGSAADPKFVSSLSNGLTACKCQIPNPDAFEWAIGEWFGASAPPLAWVEMPALKKGSKDKVGKLVK